MYGLNLKYQSKVLRVTGGKGKPPKARDRGHDPHQPTRTVTDMWTRKSQEDALQ